MAGSNSLAALYPSGTIPIAAGNASVTQTVQLGSLLNSDGVTLFDAKSATIVIANVGTGQTINAASLSLYDTVGNQVVSIAYALSSVSVTSGATGSFVVQLSSGILKNAQLSVTFAGAPVAGNVAIQAVFHETGDPAAISSVTVANANANGQSTMVNSAPVVIASDQTPLPIKRSAIAVFTQASGVTTGSTQNSGDFAVGAYTELSIDINTTAQSGTSPTIQYLYERKGADGIYYVLWQSAVLTAAANTLSTSIGAGMAYNQSLGLTGRLRWVIGGSATPVYTHSLNIYGK